MDDVNAPFDPNCLVSFGNSAHNANINATVVSPNFVLTVSSTHWYVGKGYRIKTIGNTNPYLGKDANGVAHYSNIYLVADKRDISGPDLAIFKIKKAINPADPNIPEPTANYDWTNDPNGYFEDANFISYMPLYNSDDELGKDVVIAGFGPQRIFGVHDLFSKTPYEYAVGSGILHWGYNQISTASTGSIGMRYDTGATNGEVPNEVGVGVLDSGTGMYIDDASAVILLYQFFSFEKHHVRI